MTRNEFRDAYGRYSARVPYFPQLILLIAIVGVAAWSSLMSVRYFMEYVAVTGQIMIEDRWSFASLAQPHVLPTVIDLGIALGLLVTAGIALRIMPFCNEGHSEADGRVNLITIIEGLSAFSIVAILVLFGIAFVVWMAVMVVFMYIPGLLGTAFNIFFVPPAILLTLAANVFMAHSIYRSVVDAGGM